MIKIGRYLHFKGKEYEVIGIAKDSESLEDVVVYRALYNNGELWIRSLKNFQEKVEKGGRKILRFKYIGK